MSIYWSLKNVPELAPLTRQQRRRVHEQCLRQHFLFSQAPSRFILAALVFLLVIAGITTLGIFAAMAFLGELHLWHIFASALIGALVGSFVVSRIAIPVIRPFYREIIERDL
jgi:hypothetical protein